MESRGEHPVIIFSHCLNLDGAPGGCEQKAAEETFSSGTDLIYSPPSTTLSDDARSDCN